MRTRRITRFTRVIALAGAGLLALTGCGSAGSTPATSYRSTLASTGTTAPVTSAIATTPATTPAATSGPVTPRSRLLIPVWPFTTLSQVEAWQAAYRSGGHQPWHLDVDQTALSFTQSHLGYTEVTMITTRSIRGSDAHIGVGWLNPNNVATTVGVLHLVTFGSGQDAPWVVVGSDDTTLTVTRPPYGASVRSPLTVGGVVTGVDESLRVVVLGPTSSTPLAEVSGLPAGGERTSWSTQLRFSAPRGTVLVVAVSTGGHLKAVEHFALTAVRAA